MVKRIPGTRDILPEEAKDWQKIEEISRKIFWLYNYREIRPPVIEYESLFSRSLGEFSELIQKQMFIIKNNEDTYALRPEGTASIVRAYIENELDKTQKFSKFYYLGPMFRLERPQKGRLRQFHHIGIEAIGSRSPALDVEVISLADALLNAYGIDGYLIKINSLGCLKDKKELTKILQKCLSGQEAHLCPECKVRLKQNILRILDCKNEACKEIVGKLRIQDAHLCQECKTHFSEVKEGLDELGINYQIDPHLVRGLDYYTRTIFEISHPELGAQDALGAGGRYDNLAKELGGPDVGAVGFAFGVERVLLIKKQKLEGISRKLVFLVTLGQEAKKTGLKLLGELRKAGIAADTDYEEKSLKGSLRRADDLQARFVVIIGDNELKKHVLTLKDMSSGEQKEIKAKDLLEVVRC